MKLLVWKRHRSLGNKASKHSNPPCDFSLEAKSCPLLEKLPIELRNKIYRYVLRSSTGVLELCLRPEPKVDIEDIPGRRVALVERPIGHSGPIGAPWQTISLEMLQACKQIHVEAKDLIWQLNKVYADERDYTLLRIAPDPRFAQKLFLRFMVSIFIP